MRFPTAVRDWYVGGMKAFARIDGRFDGPGVLQGREISMATATIGNIRGLASASLRPEASR